MNIILIIEMIGTVAFAVSGASVAVKKKMDVLGVAALGMTTAVGGGIIRDLILGITPPTAFQEPVYALLSVVVSLIVFIPKIREWVLSTENNAVLLIMDSLGLAVFTVVGVRAGMPFGNRFLAVFVGALTGVGGGILRDLFAGDRPYVFIKHFYACASLIGAIVAAALWGFGEEIAMTCGAVVVLVLRLLAAIFKWSLPKA